MFLANADLIGPSIAAGIAALGYVGKLGLDAFLSYRAEETLNRARLLDLLSILRASKAVYEKQNMIARELADELHAPTGDGLELILTRGFPSMTLTQLETHRVIRGYSEFALGPLNLKLTLWLEEDRIFRTARTSNVRRVNLARKLNELDVHLRLWHAKFEAWMPDPRHALVYLNDERGDGVKYPAGVEQCVEEVLLDLGATVPPWEPESKRP